MKNKTDTGICPEVRALAAQRIITAFLSRLQQLDPEARTFAAQALEDAAAGLELEARGESDAAKRKLLRATLHMVETIQEVVLGASPPTSARPH
jgi:esterase/lipase superfamily enzyme